MSSETIDQLFLDHIQAVTRARIHAETINRVVRCCVETLRNGGQLLFCGNGGSAADAGHLSAELSGRFLIERKGYAAYDLGANQAACSAIANDYGFENVYSRQIEALGRMGDCIIALTTSGKSENIVRALQQARKQGLSTIGLLGRDGVAAKLYCDIPIVIDSANTARIQEIHILIGHIICEQIEQEMY